MLRWLPWRWIVRRAARAYGVIDPLRVMARMRRFSQPSEIAEPLELLRAGIIFHARGLVNTKAIQHNLDWVWPYWVVRQFDPADPSFIPRAFSFSHVNLTHRNWTAVGLPGCSQYPLVDPRGLFTPLYDGWSIDCWIVGADGGELLPSHLATVDQRLHVRPAPRVETVASADGRRLVLNAWAQRDVRGRALAVLEVQASGHAGDRLAISIRPYNPEGIQFIDRLAPLADGIAVNDEDRVSLDPAPERLLFDTYEQGDVHRALHNGGAADTAVHCATGMATGAALYALEDGAERRVRASVPLPDRAARAREARVDWKRAHAGTARLQIPDPGLSFLYDAACTTLVLLAPGEIYPGPYTYRRFWFRDACLIAHALLATGHLETVRAAFDRFPAHQRASGYFQSQEGEWDSNGQVLWAWGRLARLTGDPLPEAWYPAMRRAVGWIRRKRLGPEAGDGIAGLLPAGFSAEHLGPNDYYYWDNWWALAGLREAERVFADAGRGRDAERARAEADSLEAAIRASIDGLPRARTGGAIPAAPWRRMDAGAIGSLVADYPLQLTAAADPQIMATVEYLLAHSFHERGFFQNMIHSGINAYLTLDIAQTLLRADQPHRAWPLIRAVAEWASPTGQWPEAIHPLTGGGCMGDGQHAWAAAEWVMIMRALFLREEGEALVLGSGIPGEWLQRHEPLAFGPTPTPWGPVEVRIEPAAGGHQVRVVADWRGTAPVLEARVPGYRPCPVPADGWPQPLEPGVQ
ncbi:MAG: hypothetical protein R3225_07355 [Halofilum sp. (in: g-proteobacteria)]|nr:hypothetical protein [Halofilum sp. (in: g-proteobacteria)]